MSEQTLPPRPERPRAPPFIPIAIAALALLAVGVAWLLLRGPSSGKGPAPTSGAGGGAPGAVAEGAPDLSTAKAEMTVPEVLPEPAVFLDVIRPAKVRKVADNAWLQEALTKPLGRGFLGAWAGFFGSHGEDMRASFSGTVYELVTGSLLSDPFRVTWFSGKGVSGAPAVVVPKPGAASRSAFAALDTVARRGTLTAPTCPDARTRGVEPDVERTKVDGEKKAEPIEVARWLVAEQPLFAGMAGDRIVLGRNPAAVLYGLCSPLPQLDRASPSDAEAALSTGALGREAQLLAHLLGLGPNPRLAFNVESNAIVPRGLTAEVLAPDRLDKGTVSEELLRLVPEDTGVVLTMLVRLPDKLDRAALKAHLGKGRASALATRQVAILWNPRGADSLPTDVAVVWSRADERTALEAIFSGANPLSWKVVCNQLVLASTAEMLDRVDRACQQKVPSVLSGAPTVVAGLRAPTSVGVGVNVGRLLSQVTLDAWLQGAVGQANGPRPAPPPEIEEALRQLESLPFLGFRAVIERGALVPGGFRS